ncbi:MAG: hypothetical protein H6810_11950 [Phycisphaeraceae bacterium]|nr:MAG: hypothetical protein H6810_11950 [Phycisphaeraceae bacterium]
MHRRIDELKPSTPQDHRRLAVQTQLLVACVRSKPRSAAYLLIEHDRALERLRRDLVGPDTGDGTIVIRPAVAHLKPARNVAA